MSSGGWSAQEAPGDEEIVTDKYLPASLEQRGYALPFTTRPVAYARVFQGKEGLEIILPGFADSLVAHVIPYEKLPSIATLSVFDRALHEKVAQLDAVNPNTIRDAASKIGETGLGGVDVMRKARAKKVIFTNLEPAILNALTDEMLKYHGSNQAPANVNMTTDEGRKVAVNELERIGKELGCDGETIVERLDHISKLMAQYKGSSAGLNGPICDILIRMKNLSDDMRQWLIPEPVEEAEMAQRTSVAILDFIALTKQHTNELDAVYDNIDRTVAQWDVMEPKIQKTLSELDLLLDGWERILDAWDSVMAKQRFIQRETLAAFAPFIPVLPLNMIKGTPDKWLLLRTAQLRWLGRVKYMKDMKDEAEMAFANTRMEIL